MIASGKSTYGDHDFVQIADGRIFAANNGAFHIVTKAQTYAVKAHNFGFMKNGFLCYGTNDGNQILYCQSLVEKGRTIVALIRLDVDSGQYAYAKLRYITDYGNIKDFDNEFWYVDGKLDPLIKGRDMAQVIHKKTGEIYRIKAGALGKYRLSKIVRLSNGNVIFDISATGSSRLFKPNDFWGYLKEMNPSPEKLEWIKPDVLYPQLPKLG